MEKTKNVKEIDDKKKYPINKLNHKYLSFFIKPVLNQVYSYLKR